MFFKSILFGSAVLGSSAIRFVSEDYLIENHTEKTNKKETFFVVEKSNEQDIVYQDFLQKIEDLNKNINLFKVKNLNMLEELEVLKNQLEINNKHKESVIVEKQAKIDACKYEIERIKRKITSNEESIKSSIFINSEKKEVLDDELIKLKPIEEAHTLKTNKKASLVAEVENTKLEKTKLLKNIEELKTLIKSFENQLIPIKQQYKDNKDKIAEYLQEAKTLKNANEKLIASESLNKKIIENFELEMKKAAREIVIKTQVYNALKIESDLIDKKLKKTNAAKKHETTKNTQLIEQKNTLQSQRRTLVSRIAELEVYKKNINDDASTLKSEISQINQSLKRIKQENTEINIENKILFNNQQLINSQIDELNATKEWLENFNKSVNSGGENKESLKTVEENNFNQSIASIESKIENLKQNSKKLSEEKSKLTEEKAKIEKLIQEYKAEIKNDLSNNDLTNKYQLQKSWIPEFEYDLNEISYFILLSEAKLENCPVNKLKFEKLKSLFETLKNDHDFLNKSIIILKSKYDGLLTKINASTEAKKYEPTKDEKESILQSINSADIFSKFFKEKLNQIKTALKEFSNNFTSLGKNIQFDFEFIEKEILGLEEDQKKWKKFKEEFEIETQEYDDLFDMATLFKKIVNKKQKQVKELESKKTEIEAKISIIENTKNNKKETRLSQNFDSWYEKLLELRSALTNARKEYSKSMIKVFNELFSLESDDYFFEIKISGKKIAKKENLKINLSELAYSLGDKWASKKFISINGQRIYLLDAFNTSRLNNELLEINSYLENSFVPLNFANFKSGSQSVRSKNMTTYSFNIHAAIDNFSIVFDKAKPNNTKSNIKIGVATDCEDFDEFQSNVNNLKEKNNLVITKRQDLITHLESSSNVQEALIKNELSIIHQIEADELKKILW